jgi:hypothetical protein
MVPTLPSGSNPATGSILTSLQACKQQKQAYRLVEHSVNRRHIAVSARAEVSDKVTAQALWFMCVVGRSMDSLSVAHVGPMEPSEP